MLDITVDLMRTPWRDVGSNGERITWTQLDKVGLIIPGEDEALVRLAARISADRMVVATTELRWFLAAARVFASRAGIPLDVKG